MLTMVQHQQHPSIIDDTDERVDRRQTRLDRQAQGIQHRDGHAVSVSDRSQVAIPTAISEFVCNLGADLQRETGFPIPSGPVSVTSRLSDRSRRTSFSSALRPTKLVKWRRVECWTETIFGIMIGRNPLWQNG